MPCGRVVDLEQDEPGFEPDHVECQHAGRADPVVGPGTHERVPRVHGPFRRDPDFVPEIARVARARDIDRDSLAAQPERGGAPPEVAEVGERFPGRGLEDRPRERTLERDRRDRLALVLDRDVEAAGVE